MPVPCCGPGDGVQRFSRATRKGWMPSTLIRSSPDRLRRLRRLAWALDESIPLPGGYRIGIDPILGLLPGLGDTLGALLAAAIVNEARRTGAPTSVLLRMIGNVLVDAVVGSIPVAGDIFDAGFKSNLRNYELLSRLEADPVRTRRRSLLFVAGISALIALTVIVIIAVPVLIAIGLAKLF